jgi:4-hydroxybenzoate polyprenyltransferase
MLNKGPHFQLKPIHLFLIAANSLLFAGFLFNLNQSFLQVLFLFLCCSSGVYIIYKLIYLFDFSSGFIENKQNLMKTKRNWLFIISFTFLVIPLSIYILSSFQVGLFISISFFGVLYSFPIRTNKKIVKVKNIFILKNILIGACWGCLVLIGANDFESKRLIQLALFCSLQVFIGSVIRDIPDLLLDSKKGAYTLPLVLGVSKTIGVIQIVNLISIFLLFYLDASFLMTVLIVSIFRLFTLTQVNKNEHLKMWTQTANLMTCFLIFLLQLIQHFYGNN